MPDACSRKEEVMKETIYLATQDEIDEARHNPKIKKEPVPKELVEVIHRTGGGTADNIIRIYLSDGRLVTWLEEKTGERIRKGLM